MKNKGLTRPITDLRNTNEISSLAHESNEAIHISRFA